MLLRPRLSRLRGRRQPGQSLGSLIRLMEPRQLKAGAIMDTGSILQGQGTHAVAVEAEEGLMGVATTRLRTPSTILRFPNSFSCLRTLDL